MKSLQVIFLALLITSSLSTQLALSHHDSGKHDQSPSSDSHEHSSDSDNHKQPSNSDSHEPPSNSGKQEHSSANNQAGSSKAGEAGETPAYHKHFSHAKKWAKKFDDPERDVWQKPEQTIAQLPIKENGVFADLGAGTGYFAIRVASKYPNVKVIAADIEPDMVSYLKQQAKSRHLKNLIPYRIDSSKPSLPSPANIVLIVNTLHHIDKRVEYLKALKDNLTKDGVVEVIDFTKESPTGPPKEFRLDPAEVTSQFEKAGYKLLKRHPDLPYQYMLEYGLK